MEGARVRLAGGTVEVVQEATMVQEVTIVQEAITEAADTTAMDDEAEEVVEGTLEMRKWIEEELERQGVGDVLRQA